MPFHALVASPLGPILLEASETGLTGLYFTDQRDCPRLPGLDGAGETVSDPAAGTCNGRPTRLLRPVAAGADLVDGNPDNLGPAPHGLPGGASVPAAAPRLLQSGTPAGARAVLDQAGQELQSYWSGARRAFSVPLAPRGTSFQLQVWRALQGVACGMTLSYGELARRAGFGAGHGRAVGAAVGANPISILIPCHRILARDGTLNGYGGGLSRKVRLLQLEGFELH
jgi:methylated-DNA-[protein]-cysteine S-methyltransferase